MTPCSSQFAEQIQAYHDARLDPSAAAQLEAHLATCPACAAELRELQSLSKTIAFLATSQSPRISQIGLARIHKAVDAVADDQLGIVKLARWLSGVAAAVLVAATVALMTLSSQSAQAQFPDSSPSLPQPWERIAVSGDAAVSSASSSQQSNVVDAEWIVADLSRRSMP